jgi:hypothetical protein
MDGRLVPVRHDSKGSMWDSSMRTRCAGTCNSSASALPPPFTTRPHAPDVFGSALARWHVTNPAQSVDENRMVMGRVCESPTARIVT